MTSTLPDDFSFTRYLAAKKSVDDRSLNRHVWDCLLGSLPPSSRESPLKILEVGSGIGTMIERFIEWDLVGYAGYTAVDSSADNVELAIRRLESWALGRGMQVFRSAMDLALQDSNHSFQISFVRADLHKYLSSVADSQHWDLLVAHAFLDLMDVPTVLPGLFRILKPAGLFLMTINFDGVTILEPTIDPALDEQVLDLYHRTMDDRRIMGRPSGDSRTGRHLFHHLKSAGAEVLSSGASDWVVFAGSQGYPGDEAYFLHYLIHTIEQALAGHPELDRDRFEDWIRERDAQINRGELVLIAHQIDFCGKVGVKTLQVNDGLLMR